MKKKVKWMLILLCISIISGICIENGIAIFKYQKASNFKGKQEVQEEQIKYKNVECRDGRYVVPKKGGTITITTAGEYVNKFTYYYLTKADFQCLLKAKIENGYGNIMLKEYKDDAKYEFQHSVVNINNETNEITLSFEDLSDEIIISSFVIDNSYKPSPIRMFFWASCIFLMAYLYIYYRQPTKKIEQAFVVSAFVIGLLLLAVQPPQCNAWDEHVHFRNVYRDPIRQSTGKESETSVFLYDNPQDFSKPIQSIEERLEEIKFLNSRADVASTTDKWNIKFSYNRIGYTFQILATKLANYIHLPFYGVWLLGKFSNLLFYCIMMYFAIKITPIGKNFLAMIGLLPTTMFLTASYTYDIMSTACISLAFAIIIKAFYYKNKVMDCKEMIAFWVLVIIGGLAKQGAYLPVILLILLLPHAKFNSKREEKFWKGILLVGILICLIGMIILLKVKGLHGGDLRGGNTDRGLQFANIIAHPLFYLKVLFGDIASKIFSVIWLTGGERGGFMNFGYSGSVTQPLMEFLLLAFVGITDTYEYTEEGKIIKRKELSMLSRIGIIGVAVIVISMIFTALYLDFTEVGSLVVEGVQARYLIPILWGTLLAVQPIGINNVIPRRKYETGLFVFQILFLMYNIYVVMLIPSCI